MTKLINPWERLEVNCKIRANTNLNYEFNWFTDLNNRYCFGIVFNNVIEDVNSNISMKNIDILKGNIHGKGNIQLVLFDKSNWQLFKNLCDDIMQYLEGNKSIHAPENLVEQRLLDWKKLFEREGEILPLKVQMGLISELYFLKELSSEYSIERVINAWCGADRDNQDFAINNRIYEIKSYILTKGEVISISSTKQLVDLPGSFFLITIGLLKDTTGVTIQDIINTIDKLIGNNSELKTKFYIKLSQYGYYLEFLGKQNLYKFAFKSKAAYLVNENFPRIKSIDIGVSIK